MALFGSKKTGEKKSKTVRGASLSTAKRNLPITRDISTVLKKPRITEKAAFLGDKNVYVFEVRRDATKHDVAKAVEKMFKVIPLRVTIVNQVPRTTKSRARARKVTVSGLRKAHVFLKKGDVINLV
jgi:large subunit ribosomal protein L23